MRSIVPPNDRIRTTETMSPVAIQACVRLIGRAGHPSHPGAEQRRGGAAGERRPAELEEPEDRVERRPEPRPRLEPHDAAVDRLARVERVADGLEIEDAPAGTMATVAMRKIADEYLTAAAGPTSHSPPPIEVAAMMAPGPITANMLRRPNGGGAGSSATSQGGSSPWPGGSIGSPVSLARDAKASAVATSRSPARLFDIGAEDIGSRNGRQTPDTAKGMGTMREKPRGEAKAPPRRTWYRRSCETSSVTPRDPYGPRRGRASPPAPRLHQGSTREWRPPATCLQ